MCEDYLDAAKKMIVDKKDIPILACALALGLDIISGDKHFLNIDTDEINIRRLRKVMDDLESNG